MLALLTLFAALASAHDIEVPWFIPCKEDPMAHTEVGKHQQCSDKIKDASANGVSTYKLVETYIGLQEMQGNKDAAENKVALAAATTAIKKMFEPKVDRFYDQVQEAANEERRDPDKKSEVEQSLPKYKRDAASVADDREEIARRGAGERFCKAGDCETGRLVNDWWAKNQPNDGDAQKGAAKTAYGSKDYRGAAEYANRALRLNPKDAEAYGLSAASKLGLGDKDGAYDDAKSALDIDPNQKLAMGIARYVDSDKAGPLNSAADPAQFQKWMFGAKEDNTGVKLGSGAMDAGAMKVAGVGVPGGAGGAGSAAMSAAYEKFQIGDFAEAIRMANAILEKDPNNVEALLMRANARNMMGDYEGALQDAQKAKALGAKGDADNAAAWALNKLGRYDEALAASEAAVRANPDDALAYLNRATAKEGLGQRGAALEDFKKAAALNPAFKGALDSAYARAAKGEGPGEGAPAGGGSWFSKLGGKKGGMGLALLVAAALGGLALKSGALGRTGAGTGTGPGGTSAPGDGALQGTLSPRRVSDDVPAGSRVGGKYEVQDELGRGGMGIVYRGMDSMLERPVAIKRMRAELGSSKTEKQRFLQEARMVAALQHPGIVGIHDVIEENGDLFLVFEYVHGRPLDNLIADGALPLEQCKKLLRPVCEALGYAHMKKIIHRDLKPSNILVADDGSVKVMDFGIARQAKDTMARMSMTDGIGTPAYMPPEQERGMPCKESDIYALGATLYEMATGRLPFQSGNFTLQKQEMAFPRPTEIDPTLPKPLDALIEKALHADPKFRFHTPQEFWRALEALPDGQAARA